jgi:hypothetical protein
MIGPRRDVARASTPKPEVDSGTHSKATKSSMSRHGYNPEDAILDVKESITDPSTLREYSSSGRSSSNLVWVPVLKK